MATKKIKFKSNYFISQAGYVFKIENGKEERIEIHYKKTTVNPFIYIDDKPYDLLYLMLEYFEIKVGVNDSIRYKKSKTLEIPLSSIKIIKSINSTKYNDEDAKLYIKYKCDQKAYSTNIRCEFRISGNDIFGLLKAYGFKCVYCASKLKPTWHLDHFIPVSKGGKNKISNLVTSCPRCNMMKGDMHGIQFIAKCDKILKNNIFGLEEK